MQGRSFESGTDASISVRAVARYILSMRDMPLLLTARCISGITSELLCHIRRCAIMIKKIDFSCQTIYNCLLQLA